LRNTAPDSGRRETGQPRADRRGAAQRSGELARFRTLHFATHGYVDDERSALVLSMRNGAADARSSSNTERAGRGAPRCR
jgi:CHAT domain-containing protein